MARPVLILGNGGHAAVLKDALAGGVWRAVNHHSEARDKPEFRFSSLALGMGSRSVRRAVVEDFALCRWATIIHRAAYVADTAQIGEGAQIMAGAIVQANAFIGKHAIINTGAQVDHGCKIGDFAHICPGAVLCADVTVEEGAMVEPGQVVRRGETIGIRRAA